MIDLYDSQITDILPSNFKNDVEVQALSYALKKANQKLLTFVRQATVNTDINNLSESILDLLATELRTQYYEDDFSIEMKRELIKQTLIWHLKLGTASAVEELVQTVFGEGKVLEWYEYNGEPFYFKIQTNAPVSKENFDKIERMIGTVKNARSHLESIDIIRRAQGKIKIAGKIMCNSKIILRQEG